MSLLAGTWNLDTGQPQKHRAAQRDWLRDNADLWLVTEVHLAAVDGNDPAVLSDAIPGMPQRYWSGIVSQWPLQDIRSGQPTLALARAHTPFGTLLVASSVLPWRGAGSYWPSGPGTTYEERFSATLATHREAIAHHASPDEGVIWGGDFNQALAGGETVGSLKGREGLLDAFRSLGLEATTAKCPARQPTSYSIDHIAAPPEWVGESSAHDVHTREGTHLSDHPAYVTKLTPPSTTCPRM